MDLWIGLKHLWWKHDRKLVILGVPAALVCAISMAAWPELMGSWEKVGVTATILCFWLSVVITLLSVHSSWASRKTLDMAERTKLGLVRYYKDFFEHMEDMRKAFNIRHSVENSELWACLSTPAYGLLARKRRVSANEEAGYDTESIQMYFKMVRDWLKWISSLHPHAGNNPRLRLSVWTRETHREMFGMRGNANEQANWIKRNRKSLLRLHGILKRVRALATEDKLDAQVFETKPTDYRLFIRREDRDYRGLMVVMTPLSEWSVKSARVHFSAILVTDEAGYDEFRQLCEETMRPESPDGKDITQDALEEPEKFIEEWFGVSWAVVRHGTYPPAPAVGTDQPRNPRRS